MGQNNEEVKSFIHIYIMIFCDKDRLLMGGLLRPLLAGSLMSVLFSVK